MQEPPRIVQGIRSRSYAQDSRITPGEAFKRGFFGGFGLWCSFSVLNLAFLLLLLLLLVWAGIIGTAADAWSDQKAKPRAIRSRADRPPASAPDSRTASGPWK